MQVLDKHFPEVVGELWNFKKQKQQKKKPHSSDLNHKFNLKKQAKRQIQQQVVSL